jgi:hypothetical protein
MVPAEGWGRGAQLCSGKCYFSVLDYFLILGTEASLLSVLETKSQRATALTKYRHWVVFVTT